MENIQHRPIQDIWKELLSHPDCLYADLFQKSLLWENLLETLEDEYTFDEKTVKDWYFTEGYLLTEKEIEYNIQRGWEYSEGLEWSVVEKLVELGLVEETL